MRHLQPNILLRRSGATLLEVMIMFVVLSLAMLVMYSTLMGGVNLAYDTESRIRGINLAREGIEAVTNMRNTNWLRFAGNRKNCWKVKNYDATCMNNSTVSSDISYGDGNYVLIMKNGLWSLSGITLESSWNGDNWNTNFEKARVFIDANGWFTSSGSTITELCTGGMNPKTTNCKAPFARVITLSDVDDNTMTVTATVYWRNTLPKQVSITSEITNWKRLMQ